MINDVLSLIALSPIASLVLMAMLACYENFVARFELSFMNIGATSDRELEWSVGILIAFVLAL